jgi:hypothetical protein
MDLDLLVKILVSVGSAASIGFGVWHFYVPKKYRWYSYIDAGATELFLAIRAVNAFFSLSLILFGVVNVLLVFGENSGTYSMAVVLSATSILWITRVAFQVFYPQGTINPVVRWGSLVAFISVSLCYAVSLLIILAQYSISA